MTSVEIMHPRHPRRDSKPTPGEIVYCRYISFLDEHFWLVALGYRNPNTRTSFILGRMMLVSQLDHRKYLRRQHEDPHTLTVLGHFKNIPLSYYKIFRAKEDNVASNDLDRGRHTLVGNDAFRGPHRVTAWWPSITHYCFLDNYRTENIIGEPMSTNDKALTED
ncbi:hypothetical protein N7523_000664 [Penicillium sp. IBT 18751x]|nr:hypothetical protein N7523_000664 [Penicillium sp. IBT 18751x]